MREKTNILILVYSILFFSNCNKQDVASSATPMEEWQESTIFSFIIEDGKTFDFEWSKQNKYEVRFKTTSEEWESRKINKATSDTLLLLIDKMDFIFLSSEQYSSEERKRVKIGFNENSKTEWLLLRCDISPNLPEINNIGLVAYEAKMNIESDNIFFDETELIQEKRIAQERLFWTFLMQVNSICDFNLFK